MASLDQLITKHREKAGLTMQQAADELGVAMSTIWRWENGKVLPTPKYLRLFAHVIKLTESQTGNLMSQYKKQVWSKEKA